MRFTSVGESWGIALLSINGSTSDAVYFVSEATGKGKRDRVLGVFGTSDDAMEYVETLVEKKKAPKGRWHVIGVGLQDDELVSTLILDAKGDKILGGSAFPAEEKSLTQAFG